MAYRRWSELERKYFSAREILEMHREACQEVAEIRLRELRELLNRRQVDVAKRTGRTQESLSALENRRDIKWSTLLEYVTKGLGGRLTLIVEVGDHRFRLLVGPKDVKRADDGMEDAVSSGDLRRRSRRKAA